MSHSTVPVLVAVEVRVMTPAGITIGVFPNTIPDRLVRSQFRESPGTGGSEKLTPIAAFAILAEGEHRSTADEPAADAWVENFSVWAEEPIAVTTCPTIPIRRIRPPVTVHIVYGDATAVGSVAAATLESTPMRISRSDAAEYDTVMTHTLPCPAERTSGTRPSGRCRWPKSSR